MEAFPLKSLTIEEATNLQFKLVDSITHYFSGDEILTRGDLGVVKELNQPRMTNKVEKVLADFFNAEAAMLVRGSGTNAIRLALHAVVGTGKTILAPSVLSGSLRCVPHPLFPVPSRNGC